MLVFVKISNTFKIKCPEKSCKLIAEYISLKINK